MPYLKMAEILKKKNPFIYPRKLYPGIDDQSNESLNTESEKSDNHIGDPEQDCRGGHFKKTRDVTVVTN